jgi:hypothetical protein
MNKSKQPLLTAAIALATAFTISCSDSGGGDPGGSSSGSNSGGGSSSGAAGAIRKARISGVFQKGPFAEGTAATLNELDNDLNPTGRPYQTLITDNKGTFELRNVELVSPYAHLIANGFYRNEVTGNMSAAPITLQAIVDVTDKDNINVNILTHLEYYRVLDLADGGMSIKAAKKQAQGEILSVFGISGDFSDSEDMSIFGATESDAALLAVSLLLQSNLGEGDFSQRLMELSQAIKAGGAWSNAAAKLAMADWASLPFGGGADAAAIRSNILGWGLSSDVPAFEAYLYSYWVAHYGLGECGAGLKKPANASSLHKDVYFACKDGVWQQAGPQEVYCFENGVCSAFDDVRDGNSYFTIEIGDLTWMLHLKYKGVDGSLGSEEYYEIRDAWFTFYKADEKQNICPAGWRLPNLSESDASTSQILWLFSPGGGWLADRNYDSWGSDYTAIINCVKSNI